MSRLSSLTSTVVVATLLPAMVLPANAGDILRGGSPVNAGRRTANPGANAGAEAAARARGNARDRLARTTQAIDAVKAMQRAARAAASRPGSGQADPLRPGNSLPAVPNGLRPGGLQVAHGVPRNLRKPGKRENPGLWVGAELPTETRAGGETQVTIRQTEQQALLNWETFNVGKETTLYFDQTKGGRDTSKWIAFNKVNDPRGRPSQILGSIRADGQVYVINQNGIIFGGSSQVNVHSLTASALPLNENLVARGLLDNPTAEFLFDYQRAESLLDAISAAKPQVTFREILDPNTVPRVTVIVRQAAVVNDIELVPGKDYRLTVGKDRRTTLTLTAAGIAKAFPSGEGFSTEQFSARFAAATGDVIVQRGAKLFSPTSDASVGGRIALVGANVRNRGTIETPDGQTILAAGLQVGFTAHDSDDPSLRGLDVAVGAIADPTSSAEVSAGRATNDGLIDAPRGNVTMAGAKLKQGGVIDGRTSVSLNGRVDLLAVYDSVPNPVYDPKNSAEKVFVPRSTGLVVFGEDSVTQILPQIDDLTKAIGQKLTLSSRVEVVGRAVHFDTNSILLAPSAEVNIAAGKWLYTEPANPAAAPRSQFVFTGGQIYVDRGALLDVSGTPDAFAPLAENILTLQFRGAEFSDAPVQRDSLLRATDLTLDIRRSGTFGGRAWVGTPLGDATKFAGLIERTVAQLTRDGGSITMNAGDSVVLRRGSTLDVSGGYVRYGSGFVETTRVLRGNQLLDIAEATPDQVYDGIYDPKFTQFHRKWGVARTFAHPLALSGRHFERSYVAGGDGGTITIQSPAMALDGRLKGATVNGRRQLRNSAGETDLPAASSLSLKFSGQEIVDVAGTPTPFQSSASRPRVVIGDWLQPLLDPLEFSVESASEPDPLRDKRRRLVVLSSDLVNRDGFGSLTVDNADGRIVVARSADLELSPGGELALTAANIDVRGRVAVPGGDISLTAYNLSPYRLARLSALIGTPDAPSALPGPNPKRGRITLHPGSILSAAGFIVDDRDHAAEAQTTPLQLKGGKVNLAGYSVRVAAGSLIDVSGGVVLDAHGAPAYGNAGAISILAGRDPQPSVSGIIGGQLKLAGELRGFSGTKGGSLALQAMRISVLDEHRPVADGFVITPEFFNRGGFARFSLVGIGRPVDAGKGGDEDAPATEPQYDPGLVVGDVTIDPVVRSWVARPIAGADGLFTLETRVLPAGLRPAVGISLEAKGARDLFSGLLVSRGDLKVRPNAEILAGPRGDVSLKGDTVAVYGSIVAPGGTISVGGAESFPLRDRIAHHARTTLYLGPTSHLSAAGSVLRQPDDFGRRTGEVFDGGTITISGNILAEAGSVLDVSGASGVLDLSPAQVGLAAPRVAATSGLNAPLFRLETVPVRVDSNGGTIALRGAEMLVAESTLRGFAGGATARGGELEVSSGRFSEPEEIVKPLDVQLTVRQRGSILAADAVRGIGKALHGANGQVLTGRGYFSVEQFSRGGFDALDLGGVVQFGGPVTIEARGRIAVATGDVAKDGTVESGGILTANDAVILRAPYVALGAAFGAPLQPDAQGLKNVFGSAGTPFLFGLPYGPGRLTVEADLIDIGNLAVRGVGTTELIANGGDVRGQGVLAVPGNLLIRAGQVYPVSGGQFTLSAYDYRLPLADSAGSDDREWRPGKIVIERSGSRRLPLSAGGELNVYASDITQNGVLRAPLGSIHLGWDGSGDNRPSTIVGRLGADGAKAGRLPVAERLVLGAESETSVAAIDPLTGESLRIPYGLITSADSWIDPRGVDITVGGVPSKSIELSAGRLNMRNGSVVDIRGGGDLFAYRWIDGQGGTEDFLSWNLQGSWVSGSKYRKADVVSYAGSYWYARGDFSDRTPAVRAALLAAPEAGPLWQQVNPRFAILPGYEANYAPFAPYNSTDVATANFGNAAGYVSGLLAVGDRVHLGGSPGLPEGDYTLLPARYALLPGAVLVTPQSGAPLGTFTMPDGSSLVSGYAYNALNAVRRLPALSSRFEVASGSVIAARAEYEVFSASRFLRSSAIKVGAEIPRLPQDSGHLVFQAGRGMRLDGAVKSGAGEGGIGAMIDISSPLDVLITDVGHSIPSRPDTLVLDAARLSSFGAESLLVGGRRVVGDKGTTVMVQTGSITLQNSRSALSGPEIILASNEALTLGRGAQITQSGTMVGAPERLLVEGDGLLLRVSGRNARTERTDVSEAPSPTLTVRDGAVISGASITLDSSAAMDLSAAASLRGEHVALHSGRISLRLSGAEELPDAAGLVLGGALLRGLQGLESLSLLSYSSIDIYGSGRVSVGGELALHAGEIRGFHSRNAEFSADHILIDNAADGTAVGSSGASRGRLTFAAETLELGGGRLAINQYDTVRLDATRGVRFVDSGSLNVERDLEIVAPAIVGEDSARGIARAGGAVRLLDGSRTADPAFAAGLGASVSLIGRDVTAATNVLFPSGLVSLRATDGDVRISGRIDVAGTSRDFFDRTLVTNAGQVSLDAQRGSVNVTRAGSISVAGTDGGDAGTLAIFTPRGDVNLDGKLAAGADEGGKTGSFLLDTRDADGFTALNEILDDASFFSRRSFRVRQGDVTLGGTTRAHRFDLSADRGSITVTGRIDASGATGGEIRLQSFGNLKLAAGSELTVAGQQFDAAGKGGFILLESGAEVDGANGPGTLTIGKGAKLDLSVAQRSAESATQGQSGGILHLRAPRTAGNDDLQMASIDGTIRGASHIIVEGYKLYELTGDLGLITTTLRDTMKNEAIAFAGEHGTTSAGYAAMLARLLGSRNEGLDGILSIRPGVELINRNGDLTLGAQNSGANNDWNLGDWRFGPKSAPGILTLRAAGDLTFYNALQDGFEITNPALAYLAPLMAANPLLPANAQSWSFRLTAGADFAAADFREVTALPRLAENRGSLRLGKFVARGGTSSSGGALGTTLSAVTGSNSSAANMSPSTQTRYQVIRTGSGDIEINVGRDVQLLNQFATIYTAGTLIDPTQGGKFAFGLPINSSSGTPSASGQLGAVQQNPAPPVQYSMGGGNVTITAGRDVAHYLRAADGTLTEDSSRELPANWLYRRGFVDPATGEFGASFRGEIASTTWWVDFANFFEGVGALGGGHVSLIASRDVKNVDGLVPTNARMPKGRPDADKLVELGGGDLLVRAGRNVNGGVYYVERGDGAIEAGNAILTNGTRSPSSTILTGSDPLPEPTWLPTTLFAGKARFDVTARGDVLLGPIANPFLLPAGYNNGYWYKSFFTTYGAATSVHVSSLGGSVTLRQAATLPSSSAPLPLLFTWLRDVSRFGTASSSAQPWIKLNETLVDSFRGVVGLLPPTLRVSALSGDINLVGDLTLAPAPEGSLDLLAAGSINGLQVNGFNSAFGVSTWSSTRINVSDASPAGLPRAAAPFSFQANSLASMRSSGLDFLRFVDVQFEETGAVDTVLQTKQSLHDPGLHANDADPVRLYAKTGDISGLTLFAPKPARLLAGNDITDIALYAQNLSANDVTTVAAGRDIVAYRANSPLRSVALAPGNILAGNQDPQPGDIQLGGPGTLQVLAGRDLDLGMGASNADGTATGITTIGNRRNPFLPFEGAGIVMGAGLGRVSGLVSSEVDFERFVEEVAATPAGQRRVEEALASLPASTDRTTEALLEAFRAAPTDAAAGILLKSFYYALRDAGRQQASGEGGYESGFAAIDALLGDRRFRGDVLARGRDVRTRNGGSIDIFVPGGELRLASSVIGNPEIPPGIITETGGDISIFTRGDVDIGVGRIFTLRGGNQIIWSSEGNIAAGSASKTVASAPPTRALIDPQSADVQTDLAGLSTGGGIGVLATVVGVPPGDVDLIAPGGFVDAGDAGIRVTGNLNIAAVAVLNAGNISVGGTSVGVPVAAPVAAPNIAGLTSANAAAGAANRAADSVANQARSSAAPEESPSTITVEVLGYGGGDESASLSSSSDGA